MTSLCPSLGKTIIKGSNPPAISPFTVMSASVSHSHYITPYRRILIQMYYRFNELLQNTPYPSPMYNAPTPSNSSTSWQPGLISTLQRNTEPFCGSGLTSAIQRNTEALSGSDDDMRETVSSQGDIPPENENVSSNYDSFIDVLYRPRAFWTTVNQGWKWVHFAETHTHGPTGMRDPRTHHV